MAVSIQNHKPVIFSQSPSENPATSAGNHQHLLETTATLIKNPPKLIRDPRAEPPMNHEVNPQKKKK